jgi:hypothetical protein
VLLILLPLSVMKGRKFYKVDTRVSRSKIPDMAKVRVRKNFLEKFKISVIFTFVEFLNKLTKIAPKSTS